MNIFILHFDVKKNAQMHCDKHVVKMILESAQMLCTAKHELGENAKYKATYVNHPCNIWARTTGTNWLYLKNLALELCYEYTKRYNRRHACQTVIEQLKMPKRISQIFNLTDFALCMPEEYKTRCPVESYRNYYKAEKSWARWDKLNNQPEWFNA